MPASILELFILSLIDRGLQSKYELQRKGGVSLGSSSPALIRMQETGLVIQEGESNRGKRPRHRLKLSPAGRKLARNGWKAQLDAFDGGDVESILRLADMAKHYGAEPAHISKFLTTTATRRSEISQSGSPLNDLGPGGTDILAMQMRLTSARLHAEAKFLAKLAQSDFSGKSVKGIKHSSTKQFAR